MIIIERLAERFDTLRDEAVKIESKKTRDSSGFSSHFHVDKTQLLTWKVNVRHLISRACGDQSEHYIAFTNVESTSMYRSTYDEFLELNAIFEAAYRDYKDGFIVSIRGLISVEVFESELDQAKELMRNNYKTAAAVVAGVVLETKLRQLCATNSLTIGKLDKMNADLAKEA